MLTDERYAYWQERIGERLAFWSGYLRLEDWRKTVTYEREGGRFDGRLRYAEISASWRYKTICLTVFVNVIEDIAPSDLHLDEMIVHELMHAHMDEMTAHVPKKHRAAHWDHEERVVSTLAAIIANAQFHYEGEFEQRDQKIKRLRRKVRKLKRAA